MKRYYSYLEEIIKSPTVLKTLIAFTIITLILPIAIIIGKELITTGTFIPTLDMFLSNEAFSALIGSLLISTGITLFIVKNVAEDKDVRKKIDNLYASKKSYNRFLNEIQKLKLIEVLSDEDFKRYILFLQKINKITNSASFKSLPESLQEILLTKLEDLETYFIKLLTQKTAITSQKLNTNARELEIKNKLYKIEQKLKQTQSPAVKKTLQKHKKLLETRLGNLEDVGESIELIEANLEHIETTVEHINDELVMKSGALSQDITNRVEQIIEEMDIHFGSFEELNLMTDYDFPEIDYSEPLQEEEIISEDKEKN